MKQIIIFLITALMPVKYLFCQYIPPSYGTRYSQPLEVDSSSGNYIIGICPDKTNKDKYFVNALQYDYSGSGFSGWTNVFFYNSKSRLTTKLFLGNDLVFIYPIAGAYAGICSYLKQNLSIIFSKFILISVRTDEYNKDGVIDEDDPVALYICTKSGDNLVRLSPQNMNVIAWSLSTNGKTVIAKMEKDGNADKKFKNENELLYQIDLNEDISKVKISLISN